MHKLEGEAREYKSVQREVEEAEGETRSQDCGTEGGWLLWEDTLRTGRSFRLLFVIKAPDKVLTWTWRLIRTR